MTDDEKEAFDSAVYYGVYPDFLEQTSPEDAIFEFIKLWSNQKNIFEVLQEFAPFPVDAFACVKPSENWVHKEASEFLNVFLEDFYGQYGTRHRAKQEAPTDAEELELKLLLDRMLEGRKIEKHEYVATREYSREEVLALVREKRPEMLGGLPADCEVVFATKSITIIKRPVT